MGGPEWGGGVACTLPLFDAASCPGAASCWPPAPPCCPAPPPALSSLFPFLPPQGNMPRTGDVMILKSDSTMKQARWLGWE